MTNAERDAAAFVEVVQRLQRLETAVERLCDVIDRTVIAGTSNRTELTLIRQYVRGMLEQKPSVTPDRKIPYEPYYTLDG